MAMNFPPHYPSVLERNFKITQTDSNPGIRYAEHPSGVVVMSLSETHPLLSHKSAIESIRWNPLLTFSAGNKTKPNQNKGGGPKSGKKGINVEHEMEICTVQTVDGVMFPIRIGLNGYTLLEVNDKRLESNPEELRLAADSHGYICILLKIHSRKKCNENCKL